MNAIQLTDPTELKVVTGWLQESRIRMVRNVLFGSAAIVGAAGLGLAASLWAAGQHGPTAAERAADLKTALAELPPLKLDPVKIAAGSEVALQKGGTVALEDGGEVSLKNGAVVALKDGGTVRVEMPAVKLPDVGEAATRTASGEAIQTSVTMFRTVPLSNDKIVTGIVFPSGKENEKPTSEYCYVKRSTGAVTEDVTYIAFDHRPTAKSTPTTLQRCVWWDG